MFGKQPPVTPLELRKQLLIAESELNRDQLVGDIAALTDGVCGLADRAKTLGSIVSSAAVLAAGLAALYRGNSAAAAAKPSWLQSTLKSAAAIVTLWRVFRPKRCDPEAK